MTVSTVDERKFTLQELYALGLGHRTTLRKQIDDFDIPYERIDTRGTIVVRESDLHLFKKRVRVPKFNSANTRNVEEIAPFIDDLAVMAAQLVSTWPRLPDERKEELRLLLMAGA
ncbi:hypothetical protein [Nocardia thailandica]|uniref:hypothetical protein n=1 Tax=Nocardia thailandica TaxID=257275 RepID=UPI0002D8E233|nr:hypothetical protein [Nocardia thailandica]